MKRYIKKIILFSIFTLILYGVMLTLINTRLFPQYLRPNIISNSRSIGHTYTRLQEVKRIGKVDVLFLGSSHTYSGFDTRIFDSGGYSCFNLGSSSQTHLQTKVLLNRYLNQLDPKLIIYEIYPLVFSLDGVESAIDVISSDRNDISSIRMALGINNPKVYNAIYHSIIKDLLGRTYRYKESKVLNGYTYIGRGYSQRVEAFYKYTTHPKKFIDPRPEQIEAFRQNLAFIKENTSAEIMLVYAPITKALYQSYSNMAYFDSLMSSYGNYYNFNQKTILDDSLHFYDAHHLNQEGVNRFNADLLRLVQDRVKP